VRSTLFCDGEASSTLSDKVLPRHFYSLIHSFVSAVDCSRLKFPNVFVIALTLGYSFTFSLGTESLLGRTVYTRCTWTIRRTTFRRRGPPPYPLLSPFVAPRIAPGFDFFRLHSSFFLFLLVGDSPLFYSAPPSKPHATLCSKWRDLLPVTHATIGQPSFFRESISSTLPILPAFPFHVHNPACTFFLSWEDGPPGRSSGLIPKRYLLPLLLFFSARWPVLLP